MTDFAIDLTRRPGLAEELGFPLGMPHLTAQGLSEAWLLRRAAHLHWGAVAARAGCAPAALRDRTGARAMASIVSARISGALDAFCEDMTVRLDMTQPPSPANGWHSRLLLRGTGTSCRPSVSVELVSRFARRGGPSNRQIEAAEMAPDMTAPDAARLPRAAQVMRARSRSMRRAAPEGGSPIARVAVLPEVDLNGVGLLYFASFLRFFAAAESAALPGPWRVPAPCLREIHWYGNADAGDWIELTCELHVSRTTPISIHASTCARRASDGVLVACCETTRGG